MKGILKGNLVELLSNNMWLKNVKFSMNYLTNLSTHKTNNSYTFTWISGIHAIRKSTELVNKIVWDMMFW